MATPMTSSNDSPMTSSNDSPVPAPPPTAAATTAAATTATAAAAAAASHLSAQVSTHVGTLVRELGSARITMRHVVAFALLVVAFLVVGINLYVRRNKHTFTTGAHFNTRDNRETNVAQFYNVVTDFYRWGWGECFHFQNRLTPQETMQEGIARNLDKLVFSTQLHAGKRALDMGCGIGGPLVRVAKQSGADVVGITINDYQVSLANEAIQRERLGGRCSAVQGNYLDLPFEAGSFDVVYDLESSPHATDPKKFYEEAHRVLREGGRMWTKQYVLTDAYDEKNEEHRSIIEGIRDGNSLPAPLHRKELDAIVRAAGFRVVAHSSTAQEMRASTVSGGKGAGIVPWWKSLSSEAPAHWTCHPYVRTITNGILRTLESLRMVPNGMHTTSTFLNKGADAMVEGGRQGIYDVSYVYLLEKVADRASSNRDRSMAVERAAESAAAAAAAAAAAPPADPTTARPPPSHDEAPVATTFVEAEAARAVNRQLMGKNGLQTTNVEAPRTPHLSSPPHHAHGAAAHNNLAVTS
jgi:sterol 24-C-methyltransferase